jgi:FkbH-like protein
MVEIARLPWLPEAPASFRASCKALSAGADLTEQLIRLAAHRLDVEQLISLDAAARRCSVDNATELTPIGVSVVSNATSSFIAPAIAATGLRYGFNVKVSEPSFGQIFQSVLDSGSELYSTEPQIVLLALDHRAFDLSQDVAAPSSHKAERAIEQIVALSDAIHKYSDATVIVQTVVPPPISVFGNLDGSLAGTETSAIAQFNALLRAQKGSNIVLDLEALASLVGRQRWHDPVMWHTAKLPFAAELAPLYADHVCRLLNALKGKSRKCLVLDLDNTIWGGAIGDEGIEGIVVGQGSAAGEAFLDVQRMALALRERGIILAVCSKNEDDTARLPFRKHPDMLLREEHIAAFSANWQDKCDNLEIIARTLNIGLDSLVLLDDNPSERAAVRARLPMLAVPELPADPAYYPLILSQAGYFEATAFVPEDLGRASFYEANVKRADLLRQAGDVSDYLASLRMTLSLAPFDGVGRARIAQLINKTNQFNLTTRRYSEDQVREMEEDSTLYTLQARLKDSFGDSGMISVVICRKETKRWRIDTWLMSCRVLGRMIEDAILNKLAIDARKAGAETLVGRFRPTEKNRLVERHYEKLGFALVQKDSDGSSEWALGLSDFTPRSVPLTVT